jgi:fatty-acyl-CoA synthase
MLYAGGCVVLQSRFDPARVWQAVEEHGITFFGAVPTMFARLLEALPEPRPASLRFLFTAGAAIPVETIRAYERRGLVLKQGFGQTETSILCSLDARDAVRKAGSVGRPVFHAEVRCVDQETFEDVPPGRTGEIVVRGPITMLGYWNRPQDDAEVFHHGWLRTGDLATVDDEGFFTLVGRAREMFISGGENVYPAEVEAVLETHPDVAEVAVVGIPHPEWGEAGRAYVVAAPERSVDFRALRTWARERLAGFKIPVEFQQVDELPRTVTGKVQRHRLPQKP